MSQENVETIRAFYDAYNRGDFDALPKPLDPDKVIEPLDLRVVGNKVLVRARTTVRGAGSGIEAEFLFWAVWIFDEVGVPTRVEISLDHQEAEAPKATGLS
jgi:hypothetical protein